MKLRYITFGIAVAALAIMAGCKKTDEFFTLKNPNQIVEIKDLLKTPKDAQDLLTSSYDAMANTFNGRVQNLQELLSSNAAQPNTNQDLKSVYNRETTFFNNTINGVYSNLYLVVFRCNLIIDNVKDIPGIDPALANRYIAECKFLRALCHFNTLKLYAQPHGYTSDDSHLGIVIREKASTDAVRRSSYADCMRFIQADLQAAYDALPEENGVLANRYAAAALLAYTNYVMNNYQACEQWASVVINSGLYTLDPSVDVFHAQDTLSQSVRTPEGIFFAASYLPFSDSRNGDFRGNYLPQGLPTQLSMSSEFAQFIQLNAVDKRYTQLVLPNQSGQTQSLRFGTRDANNPFFSVPILRLSVMHLIRAEALAQLGTDLPTAIADLEALRQRAYPTGTDYSIDPSTSASALVEIARDEFRKETFCEGLWLDLQRRKGVLGENVLIRNAPWNCPGMAIQFPNSEGTGAGFIFNPEGGCN